MMRSNIVTYVYELLWTKTGDKVPNRRIFTYSFEIPTPQLELRSIEQAILNTPHEATKQVEHSGCIIRIISDAIYNSMDEDMAATILNEYNTIDPEDNIDV